MAIAQVSDSRDPKTPLRRPDFRLTQGRGGDGTLPSGDRETPVPYIACPCPVAGLPASCRPVAAPAAPDHPVDETPRDIFNPKQSFAAAERSADALPDPAPLQDAPSGRALAVSLSAPGPDPDLRLLEHQETARRRRMRRDGGDWLLFLFGAGLIGWAVVWGASHMGYNWQWYRVPRYFGREVDGQWITGPLLRGLWVTLQITFWGALLAFALGLVTALLRLSRSWAGHLLATIYLEAVRNTPLLIQMYLFYFVLSPILGIPRFWTGVVALAVFEASFISEILRGGILSVPRGQWEAAASMGLRTAQVYRHIVLPQAVPLMLGPLTSSMVNLVKSSAIVSTIAIFDLTNEGRNIISDTFMTFEIWLTVAAIYLVLTGTLSTLAAWLEARARRGLIRD